MLSRGSVNVDQRLLKLLVFLKISILFRALTISRNTLELFIGTRIIFAKD